MKHTYKIGIVILLIVAMIATVSAGGVVPIQQTIGDGSGTLNIGVSCHHNLISKEMTIQRVDIPLPKPLYGDEDMIAPAPGTLLFVNGANIPKDQFNMFPKAGDPRAIELSGSGTFDDRFAPGIYGVTLLDGNNGQPEYAIVSIYEGHSSYINFIGHAVSIGNEPKPETCVLNIVSATYGGTGQDCQSAWDELIYHPEGNHTEYVGEVNHTIHYNAVTHQEYVPEVNHTVYYCGEGRPAYFWESDHVHAKKVGGTECNPNRFTYNGKMYQITGDHDDDKFIITRQPHNEIIVDEPAHYHTIIDDLAYDKIVIDTSGHEIIVTDTEAWTETIHHDEVCNSIGSVVDVAQNVRDVIAGDHMSFVFDNGQNPGGIFSSPGNELLSTIEDPAYGIVKSIKIVYNLGHGDQTFNAQEYDIITFTPGCEGGFSVSEGSIS